MPTPEEDIQAALRDLGALSTPNGKPLTVTCERGSFTAIFHSEYVAQTLDSVEVEGRGPALECSTSDVRRIGLDPRSDPAVKDIVLDIAGESDPYRVKKHELDGTGMSVLFLRR